MFVVNAIAAGGAFLACMYPLFKNSEFLITFVELLEKQRQLGSLLTLASRSGCACIACLHVCGQLCVVNETLLVRFVLVSCWE